MMVFDLINDDYLFEEYSKLIEKNTDGRFTTVNRIKEFIEKHNNPGDNKSSKMALLDAALRLALQAMILENQEEDEESKEGLEIVEIEGANGVNYYSVHIVGDSLLVRYGATKGVCLDYLDLQVLEKKYE